MISKADWQAVHEAMNEEERRRLGPPPSADEISAYFAGTLPPQEEARVRALLVAYPELARAATMPFPDDDARPGDPDYVSEAQIEAQWQAFRARHTPAPLLRFWQASAALAAALALVFGGLLWRAESELSRPRAGAWDGQILLPGAMRGPAEPPAIGRAGEPFAIALSVPQHGTSAERVQLLDAQRRVVWESDPVRPSQENALMVFVPAGEVTAGRYTVVYGRYEYAIRVR